MTRTRMDYEYESKLRTKLGKFLCFFGIHQYYYRDIMQHWPEGKVVILKCYHCEHLSIDIEK